MAYYEKKEKCALCKGTYKRVTACPYKVEIVAKFKGTSWEISVYYFPLFIIQSEENSPAQGLRSSFK